MKHFRFVHVDNEEDVIETDVVIIRPDRGEKLPGNDDAVWSCIKNGPRVIAVRLTTGRTVSPAISPRRRACR